MFKTIVMTAVVVAGMAAGVSAQEVKLVSATAAGGLPEGVDFSVKPMGYEYGATLHFFITGEHMIDFDKKSLKAEGWKLGTFPKVSDDGTQATFSIQKNGDFIGKMDALQVEGSVVVLVGKETKEEKLTLKVGEKPVDLGPFKISAGKSKGMFSFGGEGVQLKGEIEKIKEIKVTQDGKELDGQGSSWSGDSKTFNFSNLKGEIEVTLTYWPTMDRQEVQFRK